jgi:hypothetical protein
MSAEFSRKWEMDELSDIPMLKPSHNETMEDKE